MATVKFIPAVKNQTAKGLNGTLRYCCRRDKTEYGDRFLVSGVNCVAGCAYQEFLNTKRLYNKTDGRMFYHLIQSFHPEENLTPQTAHEIALQLAEQFAGFEVVVATHTDRDHIHSHLIINSVSSETGKKYHSDKDNIQHLRNASDDLCRAYGLSVLKPKPKKTSTMSSREYRAADKGQSWKLRLAIAIDDAMELAYSREHFISLMEAEGYQVRWTADRKYITYTTPGGDRCRDNKLHEEKYRKENMEYEFRIRAEIAAGIEEPGTAGSAGSRTNRSLRSGHGQQLGWLDQQFEGSASNAGGYEKADEQPGYRADDDKSSGIANQTSSGARKRHRGDDGNISIMDGGCGSEPDRADGENLLRDAVTGWEDQRAVFREALRGDTAAETLYQEAVLDFSDPGIDYAGLGMDAAYLAAGMTNILEEDRPIEDSTTKHYRPERRKKHGMTMGGM